MNEADTCRKRVVPKLQSAGWDNEPHFTAEQRFFTDGRIIVRGTQAVRRPGKKADYILRYTRDFPIAVVEAKAGYRRPADGLQQAKDYAEILDELYTTADFERRIALRARTQAVARHLTDFLKRTDRFANSALRLASFSRRCMPLEL